MSYTAQQYGWPDWLDLKTLAKYSCRSVESLRATLSHPTAPLEYFQEVQGEFLSRKRGQRPASGSKIYVKRSDFDTWMERWRRSTLLEHR